ncbi:MAG: OsmC family protein [Flavobacteriales bacterium]|nr:OsmC family protein [Flavobacteriales bacterium]
MKITLTRLNSDYHFEARNDSGNTIDMDGSPDIGGQNLGARPMQVVLMALAGCSSIDVVSILRKMKQEPVSYDAEVEAQREQGKVPSLFTHIHLRFILTGDLDPAKVEKAARLSAEKYCSVAKILERTATLSWSCVVNGVEGTRHAG